jgi:hypothetical protein
MGALGMAAAEGRLSGPEVKSIAQTLLLNGVLMLAFGGSMDIWVCVIALVCVCGGGGRVTCGRLRALARRAC